VSEPVKVVAVAGRTRTSSGIDARYTISGAKVLTNGIRKPDVLHINLSIVSV
jgi:hypothetical protein